MSMPLPKNVEPFSIKSPFNPEHEENPELHKIKKFIVPQFYKLIVYVCNLTGLGVTAVIKFDEEYRGFVVNSKSFSSAIKRLLLKFNNGILVKNTIVDEIQEHIDFLYSGCIPVDFSIRTQYILEEQSLLYKANPVEGVLKITENSLELADPVKQCTVINSVGALPIHIEPEGEVRVQLIPKVILMISKYIRPEYDNNKYLILGFLVAALHGRNSQPALQLCGRAGSGKTLGIKYLKKLIDPSSIDVCPHSRMDQMSRFISKNFITAYDNIRSLSYHESDFFAAIITRMVDVKRKLFSDNEDFLMSHRSALLFSGIKPLPREPDLVERFFIVNVKQLDSKNRIGESELEKEFKSEHEKVLSGLIQLVILASKAASQDFNYMSITRFSSSEKIMYWAAEIASPNTGGECFRDALRVQQAIHHDLFEQDTPFFTAVMKYVDTTDIAGGIGMAQFLSHIRDIYKSEQLESNDLPGGANKVKSALTKIDGELRKKGIQYNAKKTNAGTKIFFSKPAIDELKLDS